MLECTFLSWLQIFEMQIFCCYSFKQFPECECPGSCTTEGTLVNAFHIPKRPCWNSDTGRSEPWKTRFALGLLECCYRVFTCQVWQVSQHLATFCFALWILITCHNWSWSGLNENLPLKYLVVVVIFFFFLASFLKVRFGCLKEVSFFCKAVVPSV